MEIAARVTLGCENLETGGHVVGRLWKQWAAGSWPANFKDLGLVVRGKMDLKAAAHSPPKVIMLTPSILKSFSLFTSSPELLR